VVAGTRIADGPSALATLVDPGFDPAREVVLADGTPQAPPDVPVGDARILPGGYRPDRVALEARLQAQGFLVLIDAYDPGWQAYVDGRAAPLLRANTAFRAVALPAGTHRVEMRYRPPLAVAGLCISGAALALVGWLLARAARAP
jgi:hypothetical protein